MSIHTECTQIIQQLTNKLHSIVETTNPFSDENTESIDLLLKLGEEKQRMVDLFMVACRVEIGTHFEKAIKPRKTIEEYIRVSCEGLLFILHKISVKFHELFTLKKGPNPILDVFIKEFVHGYLKEAEIFLLEKVLTPLSMIIKCI